MFTSDRDRLRAFYRQAWSKHLENLPMEPLEAQIVDVVLIHPEYHALLEGPEDGLGHDYHPEDGYENPFLHMGLHLALRDQIATGRPAICHEVYHHLLRSGIDTHEVEHRLMACLAQTLHEAQQGSGIPDETAYSDCLKSLLIKK